MNIVEWKEKFKEDKCCAMCGFKKYPDILHFHHLVSNVRRRYTKKIWRRKGRKPIKRNQQKT